LRYCASHARQDPEHDRAHLASSPAIKRTAGAISNKLTSSCAASASTMNHYSGRALAGLFGVNQHVVSTWIKKGWLRAQDQGHDARARHVYQHFTKGPCAAVHCRERGAIDIRRVEKHWFIDLLAGGA
jgi:hypothetical protein